MMFEIDNYDHAKYGMTQQTQLSKDFVLTRGHHGVQHVIWFKFKAKAINLNEYAT